MSDPTKPSVALLCKLGSALVHADEYLSAGGHPLDRDAFSALLADAEVKVWLEQMAHAALVPVKRIKGAGK